MHIGSTPDVPTTTVAAIERAFGSSSLCACPGAGCRIWRSMTAENQRFLAQSDPSTRFGRAPQLHQVDLTECAW
jgi:hypothetical protein